MDQTTTVLQKALEYLRAGESQKARSVLVRLLKQDPNVEKAWHMLAFTVADLDRQRSALQQVLRLNPDNKKRSPQANKP